MKKDLPEFNSGKFKNLLLERVNKQLPACRICGHSSFILGEEVAHIPSSMYSSSFVLSKSIPAAALVCGNCGHIELFSLGVLGLIDQEGSNGRAEG